MSTGQPAALVSPSAEINLTLRSPLAVHTGRPGVVADDTVPRDPLTHVPIVPATALKGAARDALAHAVDHPFTDAEIMRAFGGEGTRDGDHPGALRFSTARPWTDREAVVTTTTNVSLSEHRTARPGRLRTVEIVEPLSPSPQGAVPLVLSMRLRADAAALAHQGDPQVPLAQAAARSLAVGLTGLAAVSALGSGVNRGFGRVEVAIDGAQPSGLDGQTVTALLSTALPGVGEREGIHR